MSTDHFGLSHKILCSKCAKQLENSYNFCPYCRSVIPCEELVLGLDNSGHPNYHSRVEVKTDNVPVRSNSLKRMECLSDPAIMGNLLIYASTDKIYFWQLDPINVSSTVSLGELSCHSRPIVLRPFIFVASTDALWKINLWNKKVEKVVEASPRFNLIDTRPLCISHGSHRLTYWTFYDKILKLEVKNYSEFTYNFMEIPAQQVLRSPVFLQDQVVFLSEQGEIFKEENNRLIQIQSFNNGQEQFSAPTSMGNYMVCESFDTKSIEHFLRFFDISQPGFNCNKDPIKLDKIIDSFTWGEEMDTRLAKAPVRVFSDWVCVSSFKENEFWFVKASDGTRRHRFEEQFKLSHWKFLGTKDGMLGCAGEKLNLFDLNGRRILNDQGIFEDTIFSACDGKLYVSISADKLYLVKME